MRYQEHVQDHLYITAIRNFALHMSSMDNPTLQYCEETKQFSAVIPSISSSSKKQDTSLDVHMDVEHKDHQVFHVNQSINQSINQSVSQSVNQSINLLNQ